MQNSDLALIVDDEQLTLPIWLQEAAARCSIPVIEQAAKESENYQWLLHFSYQGLYLSHLQKKHLQNISVDFSTNSGRFDGKSKVAHELLIKAIGGVADPRRHICDATAGLGTDSLLLHRAGHKVTMLERSDAVALLLEDAIQRASLTDSLQLHHGNAVQLLNSMQHSQQFDIIYLDPMFPATKKKALSRKGLQALKEFLPPHPEEQDSSHSELLMAALDSAKFRVVVKRPLRAAALPGPKPGFSYKGKLVRYDCYGTKKLPS